MPTRSSSSRRGLARPRSATPSHLARREGDVVEHGQVGKEVELLEDHADLGAQRVDVGPGSCTATPSTTTSPRSIVSRPLMQRSSVLLPEPRGPDDDDDLALVHREVYVLEDVEVPEKLVHPAELDDSPNALPKTR